MRLLCLVILSLTQVIVGDENERPVVNSPSGSYRGHILKTRNDRDVLAFQGIPYALPPVGDLRFKDPVKAPKLDVIYEANDETRDCIQPPMDMTQVKNVSSFKGSEDCLYLNVYVPKDVKASGLLPVLVYIHGGGYMMGSGSTAWNGPEYLLDKDMIFVAMNYRLGILGFLSNGKSEIPGNFGMKDQVMALRWVQENIESFGGDPKLVSIGGVSAGGSSVSLQMHSPLSKGLFKGAIAQSGTAYCGFSTKTWTQARIDAKGVASSLGCSFEDKQFIKCLQKMPTRELFEAGFSIEPKNMALTLTYIPVIEEPTPEAFLTRKSLEEPSKIDFMAGVTSHESMYIPRDVTTVNPKYNGSMVMLYEDADQIIPYWGFFQEHPDKNELVEKVMKFYFGDNDSEDNIEITLSKILSDLMFNHGLHLAGKNEKGPTYLYKFSYRGAPPFPVDPPKGMENGVSHGEDCIYLFNNKYFKRDPKWSKEDLDMSNTLINLYYDFIKSGDPTPESHTWEESSGGIRYLDMTNDGLIMKSNMFKERMEFLNSLNIDRTITVSHDEL